MDTDLFLQNLRDLPLEEGRVYIQDHIAELFDYTTIGEWLADEALRLLAGWGMRSTGEWRSSSGCTPAV